MIFGPRVPRALREPRTLVQEPIPLAVKLRLTRFGRLNLPTYRVCAADSRSKRDGRVIETMGYYLPTAKREQDQVSLDAERVLYWISVGAQPSSTVLHLMKRCGIEAPKRAPKARAPRKKTTVKFAPPKRIGNGRKAKAKWHAKHGAGKSAS